MPYTFVNNGGTSSSVSTGTLGSGTVVLTRYDEAGVATTDTVNVAGYTVNNVTIPNGTGANDSVVGSTANDLFIWDDNALEASAQATANGASRYGWNRGSNNVHIEDWFGGAGNDVFSFTSISGGTALARATTIYGGTGNDVVWEDSGNDTVFGDADSDTVYGATGSDVLGGDSSLSRTTSGASDGADFLYGGSGADTIYGAGAVDSLFGGIGADTVYGGDGADLVAGDDSASTTTSGASDGIDILFGDAGSDAMFGAGGGDTLFGGAGTGDVDTLYGGDGSDLVIGDNAASLTTSSTTDGTDILFGNAGTDTMYGGGGTDTAYGGADADTAYGGDGNDILWGDAANDSLFGDAGDDTLDGGAGADALNGGTGINFAAYTSAAAGVTLNLASVAANTGDAAGDTYVNITGFIGSTFNDTMFGSGGGDLEYGGLGDDWLEGGAGGADTLYGGDGNDFLSGFSSISGGGLPDTLYGGDGNDTMLFSNDGTAVPVTGTFYGWSGETGASSVITLALNGHQDTTDFLYGGNGFDTVDASRNAATTQNMFIRAGNSASLDWILSVEYVIASNNNDIVNLSYSAGTTVGQAAITDNVTVTGHEGNDIIVSGAGNDLLVGGGMTAAAATGGAADTIWGGDGNDQIWGDDYNDSITGTGGEGGNDTLYGADGDDTLLSQGGSDISYGGLGNDVIWSDQSDWGLTTSPVDGADTVYGGDGDDYILDLGGRNTGSSTSPDMLFGGIGNDVISVFSGADYVEGGSGADAIWGGAGNDTVYGGGDADYIYGGAGTDTLYGGLGEDWYYFSRSDGPQSVVEDSGEGAVNHLVVFGTFWETSDNSTPPQMLTIGSGIRETDVGEVLSVGHVLGNHIDTAAQTGNVNVTYNSATSITVGVAGSSGSITFNPLLFADITLWNHDATIGNQIQEFYTWDPNARGAGLGGFEFVAYIG